MFGSSKRREAEALAAIREEMAAAELRARAILADALAKMELRLSRDLEQRRRLQAATEAAVETVQSSLVSSSTEVARALGQVANMCAIVAERLDADRLERRAFTEAISRASRPPVAKPDGPSQIIGGTFFATSEVPDDEISIVETNGAGADGTEDASHIDATSYPTSAPGTTIELSTNGAPATNGEWSADFAHHQEAADPRA
jgi:hypothetical protein